MNRNSSPSSIILAMCHFGEWGKQAPRTPLKCFHNSSLNFKPELCQVFCFLSKCILGLPLLLHLTFSKCKKLPLKIQLVYEVMTRWKTRRRFFSQTSNRYFQTMPCSLILYQSVILASAFNHFYL